MKQAIIVADDSMIMRNIIRKAVEDKYMVLQASNGKEAIQLIAQNKQYDIIGMILDLTMPEYDGFMVLDYFKEHNMWSKIPVSIISGDDSKQTIERAFTYQIIDMLNKPFSQKNIMNIIDKMIYIHEKN